jgi:hypothetical protein
MTPNFSGQEPLLVPAPQQEPCVSVLLPFEPRATAKKIIEASIKRVMETAEAKLQHEAGRTAARQVCGQLKELLDSLDYSAGSKSVALWANANKGKMQYWQMPVTEAVETGAAFDARRLLAYRKEEKQYLLLVMGDHFAGIYLGNDKSMSRLVANAPVNAAGSTGRHFEDDAQKQMAALERSVKHFDNALSILQRAYHLPVFIVAPAGHLACFKQVSGNAQNATALIEVPAAINEFRLKQVIEPYMLNWQSLKEKRLLVQMEQARQSGKLATGIDEVWTAAVQKRGKLLMVEEDYVYPAYIDAQGGMLYADAIPLSQTSRHTDDAVSEAMAYVLANGGKAEIMSKGIIAEYAHVAMICY